MVVETHFQEYMTIFAEKVPLKEIKYYALYAQHLLRYMKYSKQIISVMRDRETL